MSNWKANNWNHQNKTQAVYNQTPPALNQNDIDTIKSFICSKCQRFYDAQLRGNIFTGRVPLILPCEHTICEECLRLAFTQKASEIICSECHTGSSLENIDLKTKRFQQIYPVNFYVFGLLFYYKPHTTETSHLNFKPAGFALHKTLKQFDSRSMMSYDHSPSSFNANKKLVEPIRECTQVKCNRPAQVSCAECDEVFCESCCDTLHKSARGLMKHKISPLDCFSSPELKDMCTTHKDNFLEFHCKSCNKNLCCYCVLGAHKDHEFYQVTQIDEEELPEFKTQIQNAEETLKKLQITEKKVVHYLNSNSSSATSNNSIDITISRCFENLHGKLQILEKQLRKEAANYKNLNYNTLNNIRNEVSANAFALTSLVQAAKQIVDGQQKSKLNVKTIQEKLADALKVPCYLIHNKQVSGDNSSIELICGNLLSDLKDNFSIKSNLGCSFFLVTEDELPADYDMDAFSDKSGSTTSESLSTHTSSSFLVRASMDRLSESTFEFTPVKPNRTDSVESWIKNVYEEKKVDMEMPKFRKGDRASVIVTHINTPECFYIHLSSMQGALKQLTKSINNFVKNFALPVAKPKLNELYLVKYADDRQWSRGRVIKINERESTFVVLFIDYGNTKKVERQYIIGISTELSEPAPFSKMCKLFDLYPPKYTWESTAIKLMAQIVADNDLLMVIMDETNGSLEVDIITIEGNTSVRDALMFIGYGIPHMKSPTELDNIKKDLKEITDLKLYEKTMDYTKEKTMDVIVTFVTDPHNIYVNLHKNQRSLNQLHDSMLKFYKENKKGFIYAPKKDMVVAVSYVTGDVTRWYRGIITDLTTGRGIVTVHLVDIGNYISIPWNCIRRLNERFISVECQAILVKLGDIKPRENGSYWSQNSIHYFDKYIKEQLVLKMVVSKIVNPVVEVVLFECFPNMHYCINAILVKENYAESTGDISLTVEWPQYEITPTEVQDEEPKGFTMINMMKTIQSSKQVTLDTSEEDKNILRKPVEILSVVDPDLLYVKFTEKKQEQHEFNLEFQDYYSKKYCQSASDLKVNDPCVIYYKKQYCRAIINGVLSNNKFKVYLRDAGADVVVDKKNMFVLDSKFQDMRNFAIRCHLAGVIPAGDSKKWSAMACEYLHEFLNNSKDFYLAKQGNIDTERKSMPVIIWYREVIPGGPLEPSKIIYHSVNKLLLSNGLALKIKNADESDSLSKSENSDSDKNSAGEHSREGDELTDWNAIMEEEIHKKEPLQKLLSLEVQDWLSPLPLESDVFQAIPTFVNDVGEIFLHEVQMDSVLKNLEKQMSKAFETSPPESKNVIWLPGDLCSAKYFMNNNWYRGKVISVVKNTIRVVMIDYGNEEECTAKDLTKAILCPDVPSLAKKVVLHNVFPKDGKWQTSDLDVLHAHIVDNVVTVTLKHDNKNGDIIPAVIHLNDKSINQTMLQSSSNLTVHPPKGKRMKNKRKEYELSENDIEFEELHQIPVEDILNESMTQEDSDVIVEEEVENLDVTPLTYEHTVIPNESKILVAIINVIDFNRIILETVHNNSNKDLFDKTSEKIKKEADSQPVLNNPQVGMACIAKFSEDGEWYRAQIFCVNSDNTCVIWFVDFGNFETIASNTLRVIKPDWLKVPVEQHLAIIHGIELADASYLNNVFEDMSTYFSTVMTAEIVLQNPLTVRLFVKGTEELSYQNLIDKGMLVLKDQP